MKGGEKPMYSTSFGYMYSKIKANTSSNMVKLYNNSNILDVITREASDQKSSSSTESGEGEPEFFYGFPLLFLRKIYDVLIK